MKTLVINLFFRNKLQGKIQNYPHTENFHILKVRVPRCMIIPKEKEKKEFSIPKWDTFFFSTNCMQNIVLL